MTTIKEKVAANDVPHFKRAKAILKDHPEVKGLIGRNPFSGLIIVLGVIVQLSLAVVLRHEPWWVIVLVAFCFGAFVNHAMYVMIHDCCHNTVFKKRSWNNWAGIVADITNAVPAAMSFRIYHLMHHSGLGNYDLDADIPNKWELKLVRSSRIMKALWIGLFPLIQATRPPRLKGINFLDRWVVRNWIVVLAADFLLVYFFGPWALLYLLFSFMFSVGFHPLGARWIQEHFQFKEGQETYSYYGPFNKVQMNIGHHNEHHDFPAIPWSRLPKLKKLAPEFYEDLYYHKSWTGLFLRFIFDKRITLDNRPSREA